MYAKRRVGFLRWFGCGCEWGRPSVESVRCAHERLSQRERAESTVCRIRREASARRSSSSHGHSDWLHASGARALVRRVDGRMGPDRRHDQSYRRTAPIAPRAGDARIRRSACSAGCHMSLGCHPSIAVSHPMPSRSSQRSTVHRHTTVLEAESMPLLRGGRGWWKGGGEGGERAR